MPHFFIIIMYSPSCYGSFLLLDSMDTMAVARDARLPSWISPLIAPGGVWLAAIRFSQRTDRRADTAHSHIHTYIRHRRAGPTDSAGLHQTIGTLISAWGADDLADQLCN
jgi:hypothetical protein